MKASKLKVWSQNLLKKKTKTNKHQQSRLKTEQHKPLQKNVVSGALDAAINSEKNMI